MIRVTNNVLKIVLPSLAAFVVMPALAPAATILPVSFDFSTNTQYDNNFREITGRTLISRTAGGVISYSNSGPDVYASAAYDTSVTAGTGGSGGTGGSFANNDLANFTISATIRTSSLGSNSQAGFYFRLNNSDAGGYLALASFDDATGMHLRLWEGSGLNTTGTPGTPIFDNNATRGADGNIASGTDYTFSVTANGSTFSMQVLQGVTVLSSATHTDLVSPVLTAGQTGVRLYADSGNTTTMDNLTIAAVPEPTLLGLAAIAGMGMLRRRSR